jgi:hypothetical protein
MRPLALVACLAALLAATSLRADEPASEVTSKATPPPDFSRATILRIVVNDHPPAPTPLVDLGFGEVRVQAKGVRLLLKYLPFLMPFPGSVPGTTSRLPDPFALTHTSIALPYDVWNRDRAKELARLEKKLKASE